MKRWIIAAKCLMSILFIALLFFHFDWTDLAAKARGVEARYLLLSLLFSFLMVATSAWKWHFLQALQGAGIPFLKLYRWYFIGYFYSNFLPSNVGGDVARAWLAGRHGGSHGVAIASIFAERFTGMVFLLGLAIVMPFLRPSLWSHPAVWVGSAVGVSGLIAITLLAGWGPAVSRSTGMARVLEKVKQAVKADLPGPRQDKWNRFFSRLTRLSMRISDIAVLLRTRPRALFKVMSLTALFYFMMIVNVALAYRTFGEWPDLIGLASVLPASLLVAMIPITLGNLGIAEGSYVFYFGLVGISAELTLAMGLLLRVKIIMLGLVGLIIQAGEKVPVGEIKLEPDATTRE